MNLKKIVSKVPTDPFWIIFALLAASAGVYLAVGREALADSIATYAFFALLIGIIIRIVKLAIDSSRLDKNRNIDEWMRNE